MSRVRCILVAALLLPSIEIVRACAAPTAAAIDSLQPLASLVPADSAAQLRLTPHALTLDPIGRPWILDRARGRVLLLDGPDGDGRSMSIADARTRAAFPFADLAASGAYLFLLDPGPPSLTLLDLDGYARETVDLTSDVSFADEPGFSAARLLVGRSGDLWLIDLRGSVLHFDRRGRFIDAPLDGLAGSERPSRITDAAISQDDSVVLLDPATPSLVTLPAAGAGRPPVPLGDRLVEPAALAVDEDGTCFVLEGSGRIRAIARGGVVLYDGVSTIGSPVAQGRACVTPDGVLMRADPAAGSISRWRICRPTFEDEGR